MSIVTSIETIREWLEQNVCNEVKLKLPDDSAVDASYNQRYQLVNPAAFSLFVPSSDRLPPSVPAPIPSVCVQLVEGDDNLIESARNIRIRLYFSAWDPGTHGPDLFHKKNDGSGGYIQWYNNEVMAYFRKSSDGWMDAWNFVDTAIRKIENSEYLSGLRVTKENGIKFGPLSEQDSIPDFYPYWFAWVEFSVEETMTRKPDYNQFL